MTAYDWQERAACLGRTHPNLWFYKAEDIPVYGLTPNEAATEAKQICAGCPVRAQCLEAALDNSERYGIWGGLTVKERSRLARNRSRRCAVCGTWFTRNANNQVNCSQRCGVAAHRERKAERLRETRLTMRANQPAIQCAWCGDLFVPYKPTARNCSTSCARKWSIRRLQEPA